MLFSSRAEGPIGGPRGRQGAKVPIEGQKGQYGPKERGGSGAEGPIFYIELQKCTIDVARIYTISHSFENKLTFFLRR